MLVKESRNGIQIKLIDKYRKNYEWTCFLDGQENYEVLQVTTVILILKQLMFWETAFTNNSNKALVKRKATIDYVV